MGLGHPGSAAAESRRSRVAGAAVWLLVVLGSSVAYAVARASYTHEYSAVPWKRLLALEAPLPFGHRVLVPWLAQPVVAAGVSPQLVFGVVEAVAFALVLGFTAATLAVWLSKRRARAAALMIGVALVLVYVAPRRWPLLYPWDGPALAVLAVSLWAAVRRHYWLALAVTVLGAFNRETAVLVPFFVVALCVHDSRERPVAIAWAQLMLAGFIVARLIVMLLLPDNPGPPLHFTIGGGEYRVESNLRWLAKARNWPWLLVYLGVLVPVWPVVHRRVPGPLHRVALLGAAFLVASMVVANVYEPRAWGEGVYLICVAVTVGALSPKPISRCGSAARRRSLPPVPQRWLANLDRYSLVALLLGFAAFVVTLRAWRFLPVAQWPMPH